jgi:hypothetical protein
MGIIEFQRRKGKFFFSKQQKVFKFLVYMRGLRLLCQRQPNSGDLEETLFLKR